jgi:hypothetical protein
MAIYLAGVDAVSRDARVRGALGRAYLAVAALRWVGAPLLGTDPPLPPRGGAPTALSPPQKPRFEVQAPEIPNLTAADRAVADDLSERYESAAAKASAAWSSADILRRSLEERGMSLNTLTEQSLARVQLYFDLATDALRQHDWVEARANIERASYETEKVRKTVGQ